MQTPDSPEDMTPRGAERELESALRGLRPRADGVDAAELAYRLGEAAGMRRVRRWQRATAGVALCGVAGMIGLSAMRAMHAETPIGLPIASGPGADPADLDGPAEALPVAMLVPSETGLRGVLRVSPYMRQRERALREGMEGLTFVPWDTAQVIEAIPVGPEREERGQSSLDLFLEAMKARRRL